ncbi:type II toxin-antitoxin system RelE/ParE family toxin [Hyphomonas sp.]|uniref:type II toxin-antitoxin system RelE/ParE family toxin n=1 Tax=Hyphomonas sp. TaxID=87 RepID=UPI0025BF4567|nr:type II toxin-antitoxin system RelE/ParE family toxin [Hyphomonas sp.]
MAYKLTHSAEQDLIDIYVEGFRLFGERQAEAYAQTFRETFELLAEFPGLARQRVELKPPVRSLTCGVHVVVYLVMETGDVLIVRIWHGREDWIRDPTGGV